MEKRCINRLTVLGSKQQIQGFLKSRWDRRLSARYCEWLENLPRRIVCLFETDDPPLEPLRHLSRRLPQLTLLLDYEVDQRGIKGLAKADSGRIAHSRFEY